MLDRMITKLEQTERKAKVRPEGCWIQVANHSSDALVLRLLGMRINRILLPQ